MNPFVGCAVPLLFFGSVCGQEVLSVGPRPGQFADIQSAVDSAAPGSLIRVDWGVYPGFVIDKSIRIVGAEREPIPSENVVWISGPVVIRDLDADASVLIRRVEASLDARPHLEVQESAGAVILSECVFFGGVFDHCKSVQAIDCGFSDADGVFGYGVMASSTNLHLQDTKVTGVIGRSRVVRFSQSVVTMLGGSYAGFFNPPPGPIGDVIQSQVYYDFGLYGQCQSPPCSANLDQDADSIVLELSENGLPALLARQRDNQLSVSLIPYVGNAWAVIAFSEASAGLDDAFGRLWLNPATLVPLEVDRVNEFGSTVRITIPLAPVPESLGFSVTLQAGLLQDVGGPIYSTPATVVF